MDLAARSGEWHGDRAYESVELWADAVVHVVGLAIALFAGGALLALCAFFAASGQTVPVSIYILTMISVLVSSFAFNQCPDGPRKDVLARIDQAAIFLFVAGTYTPVIVMLGDSAPPLMLSFMWGAATIGAGLKVWCPTRFGRVAIPLHLLMGWSAVVLFDAIMTELTPATLWLLIAGGVSYSVGVGFHVWRALRFHNVIWHGAVVLGMALHLCAVFDCVVNR